MRSDTEGLVHILPTLRTFLRGVVRCHGNTLAASMFGFALQVVPEYPPGCIGYGKGQTMVTYHVGRFQIFNNNSLIVFDIVMRSFMESIPALVVDALMDTGNLFLGLLSAMAALFAVSQLLLSVSQLLGTLLGMFRVLHDVPVAISD